MAETVVYVRASRAAVHRLIASIPSLAATTPGSMPPARQLLVRMGLTVLGRIKRAFIIKAAGGTDEAGERWQPLSPRTIAYSRRHPGVPRSRQRARFRPSWMLTNAQRERWWDRYRRYLGAFNGDKSHAAAAAWIVLKAEGAETLMSVYGDTPVQILRDTGLLFNSLSPGIAPDAALSTDPPKPRHQVFRAGHGQVVVGTNRKHALAHHHGVPGHIPQRRLWPAPARWPSSWWEEILFQGRQGLLDIALFLLRRI